MIRCGLIELLLPGGGYALGGHLRWAAISVAVMVVLLAVCLVTPWTVLPLAAARLASIVDAGRRGRHPPAQGWRWSSMLLVGAVGLGTSMLARLEAMEAFAIPSSSMAPTLALDDKIIVDKLSLHWRAPGRGEVVAFWMGPRTFVKRVIAVGGDTIEVRHGVPIVNGVAVGRRALGRTTYTERDEGSGHDSREHVHAFEERHGGRTYRVFAFEPPGLLEPSIHDFPRPDLDAAGCSHRGLERDRYLEALTPANDHACRVPPGTLFMMGDNRDNSNDSRAWGTVPVGRVFGRVVGVWLGGKGQRLGRIGAIE